MEDKHHLEQNLRQLKLPGILENLDLRLKEAQENQIGYMEFLTLVIQDQMDQRNANTFQKNLKAARFGQIKTMEDFDFLFNKDAINAKKIRDLATCRFIDMKEPVIIAGPPGIGKTHIAKALGHEAVRRRYSVIFSKFYALMRMMEEAEINGNYIKIRRKITKPALLVLDDFALRKLSTKEAEFFYDIIDCRLGAGALIITSNRPLVDWIGTFPDPVIGGAILDRIASNAHKIIVNSVKDAKSFRKEGNKN